MRHLRTGVLMSEESFHFASVCSGACRTLKQARPKQVRGKESPICGAIVFFATTGSLRLPVMSCHDSCGDIPVVRIESSLYCADI